jgi:hypothetical protein
MGARRRGLYRILSRVAKKEIEQWPKSEKRTVLEAIKPVTAAKLSPWRRVALASLPDLAINVFL